MHAPGSLQHTDRPPDRVEVLCTALVAGLIGVLAVAVLLAWLGHFSAGLLAGGSAVVVAAAVIAVWWSRPRRLRPSRGVLVAPALLALAGSLFLRPAQYVFDGADGSVYAATAALLERQGSLRPLDSFVASLPAGDRSRVFPADGADFVRFPGGMRVEATTNRIQPGFFHLTPAWMAGLGRVGGEALRWFANPVLALVSVLAVWLLGRRLANEGTGLVAAVLVAINLSELWFARFPSSEIPMQCLSMAALWLGVLAWDTGWVAAAATSGLAFGLVAFTRIDALVLVTPAILVATAAGASRPGRRRLMTVLALGLLGTTLLAAAYASTVAAPYSHQVLATVAAYVSRHPVRTILAGAGLLTVSVAAVVAASSARWRSGATAVVAVVGASFLGWLLWRDVTRGYFVTLLSPVGAVLAVGGLTMLACGREARRALAVVLLFVAGLGYVGNPMDDRTLPWSLRRYVPTLLPIGCVGIAYAISLMAVRPRLRVPAAALFVSIAGWFAWQSSPILVHPVMRQGVQELQKVAAATSSGGLLIWDEGLPSHLPLAAQFELGRESLVAPRDPAADASLQRLAASALARGRAVHLIADPRQDTVGRTPWAARFGSLVLEPHASLSIAAEALEMYRNVSRPQVVRRVRDLDVYDLHSTAAPSMSPVTRIDVGTRDLPYVLDGFHGTEHVQGASARWTAGVAHLRVPDLMAPGVVEARLLSFDPVHRAAVVVEWNGRPLGRSPVSSQWATYRFAVTGTTPDTGGVLTLRSETFVPSEAGVGGDTRRLGLLVDWIDVFAGSTRRSAAGAGSTLLLPPGS